MKRCIKVIFEISDAQKYLEDVVAKESVKWGVQGVGQQIKKGFVQLFVMGQEDQIDNFLDCLYITDSAYVLKNIEIETCVSDHSFRGVFRIVE